jgi:hypothetical protein
MLVTDLKATHDAKVRLSTAARRSQRDPLLVEVHEEEAVEL